MCGFSPVISRYIVDVPIYGKYIHRSHTNLMHARAHRSISVPGTGTWNCIDMDYGRGRRKFLQSRILILFQREYRYQYTSVLSSYRSPSTPSGGNGMVPGTYSKCIPYCCKILPVLLVFPTRGIKHWSSLPVSCHVGSLQNIRHAF